MLAATVACGGDTRGRATFADELSAAHRPVLLGLVVCWEAVSP